MRPYLLRPNKKRLKNNSIVHISKEKKKNKTTNNQREYLTIKYKIKISTIKNISLLL
jgi:hypothetical protein